MKQVRQFSVFVSSPSDVRDERALAVKILDAMPFKAWARGRLAIETISWDDDRANVPRPAHLTPQQAINRGLAKPSECDVVVVFLWSRLGTPISAEKSGDGKAYRSGTEWEYLDAIAAASQREPDQPAKPYVLVFRRRQDPGFKRKDPNYDDLNSQWQQVEDFFSENFRDDDGSATGDVLSYETQTEFQMELDRQLANYFWQELGRPDPGGQLQVRWSGEPYPGLSPFTGKQAQIFFGRGPETDELVRRITMPSRPLLAVVGASGSGKSSLVKAGLLPRLQDAYPGGWFIVDFTPDELGTRNPFASAAAALSRAFDVRVKAPELEQRPQLFGQTVGEAVENEASDDAEFPRALIFVDQFEELFARVDEHHREGFIAALTDAAVRPRVQVVLTLRGDFYSYCTQYEALATLLRDGSYPLAPPGHAALRDMIRGPAELVGLELDEEIVQRILDDTGHQPGALALMAYTLAELFRRRDSSDAFTIEAYDAINGVKGALGKRSEEVFASLDESVQAALPKVFRKLVQIDLNGAATKIRALVSEVEIDPESRALVDALTSARLLVKDRLADGEPYVEVAHESLFRHWLRLSQWIEDVASHLRVWRQAREAAVEWERLGRPDYLLWPQERLNLYRAALEALDLEADQGVSEFLRPEWKRLYSEIDADGITDAERQSKLLRMLEFGDDAADTLVMTLAAINRRGLESAVRDKLTASADTIRAAAEKMLGENDELRQVAAVSALSLLYDADALPLLLDALGSRYAATRLAVFANLREDGEEIRALLKKGLADPDTRVRRAVFEDLDYVQTSLMLAEVHPAFDDDDESVRSRALDVLEKTADRGLDSRWVNAVTSALRSSHESVAARAKALLDALDPADYRASGCFDALLAALDNTPGDYRDTVIAALERCAEGRSLGQLEQLLRHEIAQLRAIGAMAIGRLEFAQGEDLVPLLKDQSAEVRAAAVEALGRLDYADAGPEILALLEADGGDPESNVRAAAAGALRTIGVTGAEARLVSLLGDPDPWVRAAAIRTLGEKARDAATIQALADELPGLLSDESAAIRAAAAGSFGTAIRQDKGSVADLFALAKDENAAIRAGVARGLSSCKGADTERMLLLMLDDTDAEVRAAAVRSIGITKIGGAAIRIVSLLTDEPEVRDAAHFALVELADSSIRRDLVGYLQHPDVAVRREAISLLVPVCGPEAVRYLVESLVDPDYDNRRDAAELLRTHGTAALAPHIVAIAKTGSHDANHAVDLLGDLGDPSAVAPLVELASYPDFPEFLRSRAIAAVGRIGGPGAVTALTSILRDAKSPFRGDAVQALADIRRSADSDAAELDYDLSPTDCKPELLRMLDADDARMRADALSLLASHSDPDVIAAALARLQDDDRAVRTTAAHTLGQLRAKSAVGELLQATADPEPPVRRMAVVALGRIADPAALESLVAIVEEQEENDFWLRRSAIEAVAALPDARATMKLLAWARMESLREREVAIEALGSRDAASVRDLLHELVDDADATIRRAAIGAVGQLGDPQSIPALLGVVASDDSSDAYSASRALQAIRIDEPTTELLAALKSDNERVSSAAAVLLGNSGKAEVVPMLIEAMEQGSLRSYDAPEAFEALIDDEALDLLEEFSRASQPARREAVAAALQKRGGERSAAILLPMLTDTEFRVRFHAGVALADRVDDLDLDTLLNIARREPKFRAGVAQALKGLSDAVPRLTKLAEGADVATQRLVVEALGNVGEEAAIDALVSFARSPLAEVRRQVADELRLRHASERLPILLELGCDPDDEVRNRATATVSTIPAEELLHRLTELSIKDDESRTLVIRFIRVSGMLLNEAVSQSITPLLAMLEFEPEDSIPASELVPKQESATVSDQPEALLSRVSRWWRERS